MGCWRAGLTEGRVLTEYSRELQVPDHSPWRELERQHAGEIAWAEQQAGAQYVRVQSLGYPLVCGQYLTLVLALAGGEQARRRYRWVRREEPHRWVWAIVWSEGTRVIEGPVGQEQCPDPEEHHV